MFVKQINEIWKNFFILTSKNIFEKILVFSLSGVEGPTKSAESFGGYQFGLSKYPVVWVKIILGVDPRTPRRHSRNGPLSQRTSPVPNRTNEPKNKFGFLYNTSFSYYCILNLDFCKIIWRGLRIRVSKNKERVNPPMWK